MFRQYWDWAGSNIGAMPAEFLITVVVTVIFRRPIARAIAWIRRGGDTALEDAREDARKARLIAADLYRHVTGEDHPHAPGRE